MLYVEVHSLFIYYFHSVIYANCLAIWFFYYQYHGDAANLLI